MKCLSLINHLMLSQPVRP